ncbi:hypothetical protein CC78DRAFT_588146 [Lojkania enalia]|uniref:Uncharacterized protein n=1 Tax=Lojkania enalia TaxID=147567 RepID=A0A9P4JV31_9PLEO|nr:hypothetical protein CC78DRAFT_588146 [Didymosphaeria enalia]
MLVLISISKLAHLRAFHLGVAALIVGYVEAVAYAHADGKIRKTAGDETANESVGRKMEDSWKGKLNEKEKMLEEEEKEIERPTKLEEENESLKICNAKLRSTIEIKNRNIKSVGTRYCVSNELPGPTPGKGHVATQINIAKRRMKDKEKEVLECRIALGDEGAKIQTLEKEASNPKKQNAHLQTQRSHKTNVANSIDKNVQGYCRLILLVHYMASARCGSLVVSVGLALILAGLDRLVQRPEQSRASKTIPTVAPQQENISVQGIPVLVIATGQHNIASGFGSGCRDASQYQSQALPPISSILSQFDGPQ